MLIKEFKEQIIERIKKEFPETIKGIVNEQDCDGRFPENEEFEDGDLCEGVKLFIEEDHKGDISAYYKCIKDENEICYGFPYIYHDTKEEHLDNRFEILKYEFNANVGRLIQAKEL